VICRSISPIIHKSIIGDHQYYPIGKDYWWVLEMLLETIPQELSDRKQGIHSDLKSTKRKRVFSHFPPKGGFSCSWCFCPNHLGDELPEVLARIQHLKTTPKSLEHKIHWTEKGRKKRKEKPNTIQTKNSDSYLRGHDLFVAKDQPGLVLTEEKLNTTEESLFTLWFSIGGKT